MSGGEYRVNATDYHISMLQIGNRIQQLKGKLRGVLRKPQATVEGTLYKTNIWLSNNANYICVHR